MYYSGSLTRITILFMRLSSLVLLNLVRPRVREGGDREREREREGGRWRGGGGGKRDRE